MPSPHTAAQREAFTDFVTAHSPHLQRVARHLTGDADRARDLVQHALERAWQGWDRIDPANPYPYVRRIVVNAHTDTGRRSVTERRHLGTRDDHVGNTPELLADPGSDPALSWAERRSASDLLVGLTDRERAVVVLRFLEDLSEADTATELGTTIAAVKSTTHRALGKLRVTMREEASHA